MLLALLLSANLKLDVKELDVGPLRLGMAISVAEDVLGPAQITHVCKRGPGGDLICHWAGGWSDRHASVRLEFTDESKPELQDILLTNRCSPNLAPLKTGVAPISQWRWFGGSVFSFPTTVPGWNPDKISPFDNFKGKAFFSPSGATAWVSQLPKGIIEFSLGQGD